MAWRERRSRRVPASLTGDFRHDIGGADRRRVVETGVTARQDSVTPGDTRVTTTAPCAPSPQERGQNRVICVVIACHTSAGPAISARRLLHEEVRLTPPQEVLPAA